MRTAVRRVGAGGAEAGAAAGGCAAAAGWGKGGDAAAGRCVPQPALGGRRRDHGGRQGRGGMGAPWHREENKADKKRKRG